MLEERVGSLIEPSFITWKHFIPFPRGYIFWTPSEAGKNSVFLRFKKIETDIIESSGHIICDKPYYTGSKFSPDVLQRFHESSKNVHATELRMREASILDEKSISFLFQRHNAFLHDRDEEVVVEALLYLSCRFGWDPTAQMPESMADIIEQGYLSYDNLLYFVKDEPFINNLSYDLDFGAQWEEDTLGDFHVFEKGDYWFVARNSDNQVIMKNFLYKMDAQLHAEALYIYCTTSPQKAFLETGLSVLDYVLMDSFPPEQGVVQDFDAIPFNENEKDDNEIISEEDFEAN